VGLCLCEHTCLSYYFCMPNKLFEYIRAGIPIICSDLPELRRVVSDEHLGVVAQDMQPESIVAAILAIEQRGPKSYAGALATAANKYTWTRQTTVLAAIYEQLGLLAAPRLPAQRSA
jgi:glycosyltransferase involved in cell wall biosynthesis